MIKLANPFRFLSIAALAILIAVSFSCNEDFFNEIPGDKITPESHYKTQIEVEISILGAFAVLQDAANELVVLNGLLGDLVDVTENSDMYLRGLNKHEFSPSNPYLDASGLYRVIVNVNEVLANIDTSKINDPDFTEIVYPIFVGDLIGLRSWAYFTLARLYGQVAYIPDNLPSLPEGQGPIYLSREAIFDTLVNHLDSTVLANEFLGVPRGTNIINKHALMGEIQLEKQNYDTAAYYLTKACAVYGSGYFKVDTKFKDETWREIFVNSQDKDFEVMTAVPYSRDDQQDNNIEIMTSYHLDYTIKPTQVIIDLFENQVDKRGEPRDLFRGPGVSYDTIDEGVYAINKYSLNQNSELSAAVIIYRAADIHLLLAEALNRKGQYDDALAIVNDGLKTIPYWTRTMGIRGRVYLEAREMPGTKELLEDIIMEERVMELAFEGKRWFDLMRVARARGDASYLADRVAAKFPPGSEHDEVRNRLMDMNNWYLPVK